ncbi:MAG: CYTH domain-containing protein [Clostridia bacterium]|nr:CYTH domain-containing protein [Clostridia bacterium]
MAFVYELKDDGKAMLVQDPIYGEIEISWPFTEIILTKEMQRLGDITQNGFSYYDYPGLINNERLSHSVGAFYVMSQIIEHLEKELKRYDIFISKDEKDMALCSMLLHDIGHGPFSHTFEKITEYSHEKRTTDILLGDTEVNHLLTSIYGETKLKRIASYIAEIDEDKGKEDTKGSFTKLLKSLISHQLDADRLDYLVRDSYHAGLLSAISHKNLIQSLGISVNNNQEYELLVDRKGLTTIETVLIERFQRYRDVYFSRASEILEQVLLEILNRYKEVPKSVDEKLPEAFKMVAMKPEDISLEDFLGMTDKQFMEAFETIKRSSTDHLLKYLADMPKVLSDFEDLENGSNSEVLKQRLKRIFPDRDFSDTLSILSIHSKTRLYKQEESLRINFGNVHKDLSEATPHLIRTEEYLEKDELAFNPELLRIELGMTDKEFEPYREEIRNMINELNKKPEEFELKYIIDENQCITQENILEILLENGFNVVKTKSKENDDEYYDTKDLSLITRGGSLRIRKLTQDGGQRYKATYKMPTTVGEVYSSREEIEIELDSNSIDELKEKMGEKNIDVDLGEILPRPLLNAVTQRRDIVLEKNGVQVCFSFDNTRYINHVMQNEQAEDTMIEIEALGNVGDRVMLNEINNILQSKFTGLKPNKQSKYERGVIKTREKAIKRQKQKEQEEPEL